MNKQLKLLSLVLLAAALVAGFAGCSSDPYSVDYGNDAYRPQKNSSSSTNMYYGGGFYDPWYHRPYYGRPYYPPVYVGPRPPGYRPPPRPMPR